MKYSIVKVIIFFSARERAEFNKSCNLIGSISVEFRAVIVAVFKRIAVEYSYRVSSLSATQFTVEKSNSVERFTMIDKNCFCSTTSNFARNLTAGKQFWRP